MQALSPIAASLFRIIDDVAELGKEKRKGFLIENKHIMRFC